MASSASAQVSPSIPQKLSVMPWQLFAVSAIIGAFGVAALYSISGGSFAPWAERHAFRLAAGLTLATFIGLIPLRFWLAVANPLYAFSLAMLAAVPFIGLSSMGARRWIGIPALSVQPSEFMKIALVLVLARLFHKVPPVERSNPKIILMALAVVAAPTALVIRQPDLGSGILLAACGISVIFLAGVRWHYFAVGAAGVIGLAEVVWLNLREYQKNRIFTFLDPARDPLGAGYHITQSKIALGSGGLSGKGYMMGSQSQLNFVPEKHTDFVFTMFAEETGFVGSMTLLALYALLIVIMISLALRVRSDFGRLVIGGSTALVALHANVNIGMVIGLLPVVGVPLPLVSFGGSSLLTTMIALGLTASAYVHRTDNIRRDDSGTFI